MPEPDVYLKQGDTAPTLTDVLRDQDDVPVSILAATVRLLLCPIGDPTAGIARQAENLEESDDEATVGHVQYEWQAGDTDVAGLYLAEWEVTYAVGGAVLTFPNGGYLHVLISRELTAVES